ncbi:hypothetical protein KR018_000381, partial [Drosophila ironensis]
FVQILEAAIARCLKSYSSYKEDLAKAYTLLAAHFTRQAYKETGHRRAALQAKITNILKVLDAMPRPQDRQLLVTKGYAFMLTARRGAEADAHFLHVLRNNTANLPSLIGRGCLAYNRQEYVASLGYFKSVLMHQPRGPVDIRVGIAHCFLKLEETDNARRCFELALEHNGRSQNALFGIAILKLNQREQSSVKEGVNLLCAAYELNNRHPAILAVLASHYYYARDYEKVRILAANAYYLSDMPLIQSESCFLIARSFHATKQFNKAYDFYHLSVKLAPDDYVLPRLGLAQMLVRRGDQNAAKAHLEALLKRMPNQCVGLLLLSKIYLTEKAVGQVDQAIEMLTKVAKNPAKRQDYNCWLNLAFAYEQKRIWLKAIDAYNKAAAICNKMGDSVPIEWLNNLAAIQQLAGLPQKALATLDEALAKIEAQDNGEHSKTNLLTMRFNRCRILEDLHRGDLAEIAYKVILDEYPNYYDCYMRLGIMALREDKMSLAIEYFKDVLKVDNENMTARSYLGNTYMRLGLTAQSMYNHNVNLGRTLGMNINTYTMVAVGNVSLKNSELSRNSGNVSAFKRHLEKAVQFFKKALENNRRNLWAANGIGVALRIYNFDSEGEAVFKQIVEYGQECIPAMLNCATVAMNAGQFKQATHTFKKCLQDLPRNCIDIRLTLAKSLFLEGKAQEAKLCLLDARHVCPNDTLIIYNLGVVIKQHSQQIFGQHRPELAELQRAERELKVALHYFEYLSTWDGNNKNLKKNASKQAKKCESLLANLPKELRRVRDLDVLDENRLRLQEERYQAHQKQLEEQRRQREEKDRLLREDQLAKRQEVLARTKKLLENPPESKESGKRGRGRGKKKTHEEDDPENEAGEEPPKKSRKR